MKSKIIASLTLLSLSAGAYAHNASLTITNQSSRVYLTHCVHYDLESGKWLSDEVIYEKKYNNNMSMDIGLDGKGYFACDIYASEKQKLLQGMPLGDQKGDLYLNILKPFPVDNVYVDQEYSYEAEITNQGFESHTVKLSLPSLPQGVAISADRALPKSNGNCWDGVNGASLSSGETCHLKLTLKAVEADLSVDDKWTVALDQYSLIQRLHFNTLDNHGKQMVARMEVYLENDQLPLVNWLPFDMQHSDQMDVSQSLGAHLQFDQEGKKLTIVD